MAVKLVKLFIGNLAETVDSTRLKQIFQPYTTVHECDVVKNYAFVHIPHDDYENVLERLNGYILDGKQIQVKLSTSKLHSQAAVGSGNCLRCASSLHRTPQCPEDPKNKTSLIKVDLTMPGSKRPGEPIVGTTEIKRACIDDEIPRPIEPELQNLYNEYLQSRQRYHYYRDLLLKEMGQPREASSVYSATPAVVSTNQLSAAPVQYQVPAATTYANYAPQASAPYAAAQLKAPYAPAALQTIPGVVQQPGQIVGAAPYAMGAPGVQASEQAMAGSNAMTTQQYLQQLGQSQGGIGGYATVMTGQPQAAQVMVQQPMQTQQAAPYAGMGVSSMSWMQPQPLQQQQPQSSMGNLVKLNMS